MSLIKILKFYFSSGDYINSSSLSAQTQTQKHKEEEQEANNEWQRLKHTYNRGIYLHNFPSILII